MFSGFNIGPFFIGTYGICAVVGIMTACPLAIWLYKKRTGSDFQMLLMFLISAIGVFLGMHILYGFTNISYWEMFAKADSFTEWLKVFRGIFGGSVFYGGLLGGLFTGGLAIKALKMPADIAADCATVAIPLFHGFARIGCFFAGCCYGVEWERGIVFTRSVVESANGVPRVPVQLFESAFEFLLFGAIMLLLSRKLFRGRLLAVYLMTYSVGRFILEFWRGDDYRGFVFGLSTSQFISVLLFVAVLVFFAVDRLGRHMPHSGSGGEPR